MDQAIPILMSISWGVLSISLKVLPRIFIGIDTGQVMRACGVGCEKSGLIIIDFEPRMLEGLLGFTEHVLDAHGGGAYKEEIISKDVVVDVGCTQGASLLIIVPFLSQGFEDMI